VEVVVLVVVEVERERGAGERRGAGEGWLSQSDIFHTGKKGQINVQHLSQIDVSFPFVCVPYDQGLEVV